MSIARPNADAFAGKRLLITGGTGTFGNAVLKRFLQGGVAEVRVFSRDEKKQDDMRHEYGDPKIKFYLGDVRDLNSLQDAMSGVDFVFHAAALKQVPSCEFYPMQALQTNAIGGHNVIEAAAAVGVQSVITLSTDKAVYPVNAMGISKAMMEKIMVAKAQVHAPNGMVVCGTRYGNVMGSRGSVIPLFIQQLREGRALTVTDPNMTRFMMSIEGAVDLVEFAFANGNPGDIFIQKAPAATISTLAAAIKRLFGADNPVAVIGTRHGEKLYETLLTREELVRAEDCGDYYRVPADSRGLDYSIYYSEGVKAISYGDDYNSHNTRRLDEDEMCEMLEELPFIQDALAERRGDRPRALTPASL